MPEILGESQGSAHDLCFDADLTVGEVRELTIDGESFCMFRAHETIEVLKGGSPML